MDTQRERQNFNWRPNDNSSTTLTRYSLEAEHWTKAFRDAAQKNSNSGSLTNLFGGIGLILQLIYNLVWLLMYGIGSLLVWLFGNKTGGKINMPLPTTNIPSDDEITRMCKDAKEINIYG